MIKYFWNCDSSYKVKIIFYYGMQLLDAILSVVLVVICGQFLDRLIEGDIPTVKYLMYVFIVICLIQLLLGYMSERLYTRLQVTLGNKAMLDVIFHINDSKKFICGWVDNIAEVKKINNDANAVIIFGLSQISRLINSLVEFLLSLVFLIVIFPKGLYAIVILFALYIVVYFSVRKIYYMRGYEFKEEQLKYFSNMFEQLNNSKIMHLFSLYDFFKARMNGAYVRLKISALKLQKVSYLFTSIGAIIKVVGNLMLYLLCGIAVMEGDITIGSFTIVVSMFDVILGTCMGIFEIGKGYEETRISYNRIMDLMNIQRIQYGNLSIQEVVDEISVCDLKVSYEDVSLLNGFNASFKKGKIYCVLGRNGIGKTTLFECILGLKLDEQQGDITYNGISIKDIDMRKFRIQHVSYVEQFTKIINGTLKENIDLLGTCEVTSELMNTLFDQKFLNEQSDKIYVDDGVGLSGGERQKIGLLRGLNCCKEIVLLDEPSASLDSDTTERLFSYLTAVKKDKIIIIISHDEKIIPLCDEVIRII